MSAVWGTYRRCWINTKRAYPWTYFAATVLQGAITITLAYAMYHGVAGGRVSDDFVARSRTKDYVGYVAVGAIAMAFTMRMLLWTAKALINEERAGTAISVFVSPARRLPYFVGYALFAFTSTLVEVGALCGLAGLLGVEMPPLDPLGAVTALVLFTLAVSGLSLVVNAVMLVAGEAHITQNTCLLLVGLLCGFTFPRSYLPTAAQWLSEIFPLTSAVDILRQVLAGTFTVASSGVQVVLCLAVSGAYLVAGFRLLPHAERCVIERSF